MSRTARPRGRLAAGAVVLALTAAVGLGFAVDLVDARQAHRSGTPAVATVQSVDLWRGLSDTARVVVPVDGRPVRAEVMLTATDVDVEPGDELPVLHRWARGELSVVAADEDLGRRLLYEGGFALGLVVVGAVVAFGVAGYRVSRSDGA